jgi:drug/metabolite transporter (DMT)-like permease
VATLTTCYLASNLLLQYGATRLPANATSVIMLTEVLWAAGSAIALGAGTASLPLFVGGGLIIAAAALAALPSRPSAQPGTDHDPLQRL